ncbi:MAG TPA: hypothetical protein VJH22_05640 [Candidatus Nanoarchaeia archaeon]|nr:hypothetical protein [Candidatus Nanoarchaeia archaeon]
MPNYESKYNVPYFADDADLGNTPGWVNTNLVKEQFTAPDDDTAKQRACDRLRELHEKRQFPTYPVSAPTLESLVAIRGIFVPRTVKDLDEIDQIISSAAKSPE